MSLFIFNFSKIKRYPLPAGAIIAFVLIIIAEIFYLQNTEGFSPLPLLQPTVDDAVVYSKLQLSKHATSSQIVVVGDSSAFHGIKPLSIERDSSYSAINLGTLASFSLAGYSDIAAGSIVNGDKSVKIVVIALLPTTMKITANMARDYSLLGNYFISYGDKLSTYDLNFKDYINWFYKKHRFNIFPSGYAANFDEFYNLILSGKGFLPEKRRQIDFDSMVRHLTMSDLSINAIKSLVGYANEQDVKVALWFNPKPTTVVTSSYSHQSIVMLKTLNKLVPDLILLQQKAPTWEEELFGTETHLTADGAEHNTKLLMAQLVKHLNVE